MVYIYVVGCTVQQQYHGTKDEKVGEICNTHSTNLYMLCNIMQQEEEGPSAQLWQFWWTELSHSTLRACRIHNQRTMYGETCGTIVELKNHFKAPKAQVY